MTTPSKLAEKVKKVLQELNLHGLEVEIEPDTGFKVVAVVTSEEFESMDESERQRLVWMKLLEKLDDYEQTQVEFVHTMAPSDWEPARET